MQDNHPDQSRKESSAGGVFIAFGTIAGAIVGGLLGQPSIGLICGLGFGCSIAVLIWLKER